jgi:hypothetical protein
VLGLVTLRTSHLAIAGAVAERGWNEALEKSMAAQQRIAQGLSALLADAGIEGSDEIVKLYEERPRP